MRTTVQVVSELCDETGGFVSLGKLAARLKLDKSAASRRVAVARQRGFLKNLETRKGLPAQFVLGDPLPEEIDVLPSVEALQCCTVEAGETHPSFPPHAKVATEPETRWPDPDRLAKVTHTDLSGKEMIEVEL